MKTYLYLHIFHLLNMVQIIFLRFFRKITQKEKEKEKKKIFYNQVTVHVVYEGKIMNVKLFNNGRPNNGIKKGRTS